MKGMANMKLFGFGKKKENCSCDSECDVQSVQKTVEDNKEGATIKVLGSGCAKCIKLEENVKSALEKLGMDTTVEHVTDFNLIAAYGVMTTPALVFNGKVISYGKVLKEEEIIKLLEKSR